MKIGFIGLGLMGLPMATHLLNAGYPLFLYNRTASKAQPLVDQGATLCAHPREVAAHSDILITIVSKGADVESVLFGENGAATADLTNKIIIDMSTIEESLTIKFAGAIAQKGGHMLDAPVSGGDAGAKAATLTIMVGGDEAIFTRCLPLFEVLGDRITYMGGHGAGQATKMCNQIMVIANLLGVCEGLRLAQAKHLDLTKVQSVILGGVGASAQLNVHGTKIINHDDAAGFFIELMAKDLGIVETAQVDAGLSGDLVTLALAHLRTRLDAGDGRLGIQSLFKNF